jgi:4-diphosphocytidyl-2-C-methyl-D-erythritol kinase
MTSSTLAIRSPAKLNWHLQVIGKRPDGFHELLTSFVALDFGDELIAEPMSQADCSTLQILSSSSQDKGFPLSANNLILRAEDLWRSSGGEADCVAWCVEKHIPLESGLGGGSSNAASALMILQDLATKPLPDQVIEAIARELGSDVSFFLQNTSPSLMAGRGDIFVSHINLPLAYVVIAIPEFKLSTADVFAATKAQSFGGTQVVEARFSSTPGPNQLLSSAIEVEPRLKTFIEQIEKFAKFHLSGSGSAMFAVFGTREKAELCRRHILEYCQVAIVSKIFSGPVLERPHVL